MTFPFPVAVLASLFSHAAAAGGACPRRVPGDHRQDPEFLPEQWLNRFDALAPAPGSGESALPPLLLPSLRIARWIAVIAKRFVLLLEIEAEHLVRIFRGACRLGINSWHFSKIIDLPRDDQGMVELLLA